MLIPVAMKNDTTRNPTIPPTHMGWAQFIQHGKFVRWFPRGQAREHTLPNGKRIFCTWEQGGPHPHSGYSWWYPIGEEPTVPPPEQSQRPGMPPPAEADEGEEY